MFYCYSIPLQGVGKVTSSMKNGSTMGFLSTMLLCWFQWLFHWLFVWPWQFWIQGFNMFWTPRDSFTKKGKMEPKRSSESTTCIFHTLSWMGKVFLPKKNDLPLLWPSSLGGLKFAGVSVQVYKTMELVKFHHELGSLSASWDGFFMGFMHPRWLYRQISAVRSFLWIQ